MNIKVNGEALILEGHTLADLAQQLNLPEKGVAVALDMQMIPRDEWAATELKEGVDVTVIRAASGG